MSQATRTNDRHIIWSDMNLDVEDWREGYKEFLEMNELDGDPNNEQAIYEWMVETNGDYLYDERVNLNIQLSQPIIVIGDIGRWNGRVMGYKEIPSGNIQDCLYADTDFTEWYVDKYGDLRADAAHHDGTNHYLYRVFKDGVSETQMENFKDKLYYGAGKKDFPAANVVRVLLGETENNGDKVIELACNLDDMTPGALSFAMDELFSIGALDVYFTNIGMKKSRPGVILTCMCREDMRDKMLRCIFKNTTTIGIREYSCARWTLQRKERVAETEIGSVRIKSSEGYGVKREKAEYDDLARIARESGRSLDEIRTAIAKGMYA